MLWQSFFNTHNMTGVAFKFDTCLTKKWNFRLVVLTLNSYSYLIVKDLNRATEWIQLEKLSECKRENVT